jgi:FkbM family methyltransferase
MDKNKVYEMLNQAYFSDDPHEKAVVNNLPTILKGVRIFVDIGASLGQYTYYANKSLQNAKIYAIEADPIRFEKLQQNSAEWEALGTNKLTVYHGAVSDRIGTITFYTTHSNVSGGLFTHDVKNKGVIWHEVTVESFTLDTLFAETTPDFIKIDVEGSELRVLKGAIRLLQKGKTVFLIELHSFVDPEGQRGPREVIAFMESFGYKASNFHGQHLFKPTKSFTPAFKDKIIELLQEQKPMFQIKGSMPDVINTETFFFNGTQNTDNQERASHPLSESLLIYLSSLVSSEHVTLETGGGYSTVVFGAKSKQHYCINPDITANNMIREFLHNNSYPTDHIQFVNDSSDTSLSSLDIKSGIDIALIDGNHSFPFPVIDWHFIDKYLKVGSTLFIDDIHIPGVNLLIKFLDSEPSYTLIETLDVCLVYQKVKKQRAMGWSKQDLGTIIASKNDLLGLSFADYQCWSEFTKTHPRLCAELPAHYNLMSEIEVTLHEFPNKLTGWSTKLNFILALARRWFGRKLGRGSL